MTLREVVNQLKGRGVPVEFGSGYKVAMRDVLHLVEQLEEQNEMEWGK